MWLVDHAWTFTWSTAVGALEQNEGLRRRMAAILGTSWLTHSLITHSLITHSLTHSLTGGL